MVDLDLRGESPDEGKLCRDPLDGSEGAGLAVLGGGPGGLRLGLVDLPAGEQRTNLREERAGGLFIFLRIGVVELGEGQRAPAVDLLHQLLSTANIPCINGDLEAGEEHLIGE